MTGRKPVGALRFLVLPAILILSLAAPSDAQVPRGSGPAASTSTSASPAALAPAPTAVPAVCRTPARSGFVPKTATLLGRKIRVYALGRGRGGVPLAPPLTNAGKNSFGWDKYGPKPGSHRGNVRFNAHTYPNGSALGNYLLRRLRVGHLIVVRGDRATICYRVTRKVVTTPNKLAAYYATTASPKLAIVVCSGRRLGPGRWTHRTIWYAWPVSR